MIELMIGLVAVLAVFAGLLQIASLSRTRTEVSVEARREAGALTMLSTLDGLPVTIPDYVRDRFAGADTRRHSRDDTFDNANPADLDALITQRSAPDNAGWGVLNSVPGNAVSGLSGHPDPVSVFGLLNGKETETLEVIPAVRSLLYHADSIEVEGSAWMTWTKGIY
jgi:hypothetical protein